MRSVSGVEAPRTGDAATMDAHLIGEGLRMRMRRSSSSATRAGSPSLIRGVQAATL